MSDTNKQQTSSVHLGFGVVAQGMTDAEQASIIDTLAERWKDKTPGVACSKCGSRRDRMVVLYFDLEIGKFEIGDHVFCEPCIKKLMEGGEDIVGHQRAANQ